MIDIKRLNGKPLSLFPFVSTQNRSEDDPTASGICSLAGYELLTAAYSGWNALRAPCNPT